MFDALKIAITKGSLLIPPTYFAVQHAARLANEFDVAVFAGATEITDADALGDMPVVDALNSFAPATRRLSIRRREQLSAALPLVLRRRIARWQPDLIHQHFAYASLPAIHAAHDISAPLLVTVHGGDAFSMLKPPSSRSIAGRPALARMQRHVAAAYQSARSVLAVSEYIAGIAVRGGADASRVHVHYQGIDTDWFTPAERTSREAPRLLFVGRMVETKGVRDIIDASHRVVGSRPHTLDLVGGGPLLEEARALANRSEHVRVHGPQSRENVRAFMQQADALVLPTRVNSGAREAAGLVLVEAQACGTPVIAYDSGGTPEMLRDGTTGYLTPEADVGALADALEHFLDLPDAAHERIRSDARDFAVSARSLDASCRQLADLYMETR